MRRKALTFVTALLPAMLAGCHDGESPTQPLTTDPAAFLIARGVDPNAQTARHLHPGGELQPFSASAAAYAANQSTAGAVLRTWTAPGMSSVWGLGYDGSVWLSDPLASRNYEFTVDGVATGRSYPYNWGGAWIGDMTAMGTEMCQVHVGGDNGIHCWDRSTGEVTRSITGAFPWTVVSQRGIAYRADEDAFYTGGWNQKVLYKIRGFSHATPGAIMSQCDMTGVSIAGLAWNPTVRHVWVATNSQTDEILRVDPGTCAIVSTLPYPAGAPQYSGSGLSMDDVGNLWAANRHTGSVYLIESGVPHVAGFSFGGFVGAVRTPGWNSANAGQVVVLQWSLNGDQGMGILAPASPASRPVNCLTAAREGDEVEGVAPGSSQLTYEAATDRYRYGWQTNQAWAGTCRELVLRLSDGSSHSALFRFR